MEEKATSLCLPASSYQTSCSIRARILMLKTEFCAEDESKRHETKGENIFGWNPFSFSALANVVWIIFCCLWTIDRNTILWKWEGDENKWAWFFLLPMSSVVFSLCWIVFLPYYARKTFITIKTNEMWKRNTSSFAYFSFWLCVHFYSETFEMVFNSFIFCCGIRQGMWRF